MTIVKFFVVSLLAMLVAAPALAQNPPPPPPPSLQRALTAAELAKVKAVLAPYKSASLSVDDAKIIKRSLRDAGMRRSLELDAALVAAGYSPAKLDQLDPPPQRPPDEAVPRPPSPPSSAPPTAKK